MPVLLDDVRSVEFMYFYLLARQVRATVGNSCLCCCVCGTSLLLCVWDVFLHVFVVVCGKSLDSGLCCCLWEVSGFRSLLLSVGSLWFQVFVVMSGTYLESCLLLCLRDVLDSCLCYFSGFLSLLLCLCDVFGALINLSLFGDCVQCRSKPTRGTVPHPVNNARACLSLLPAGITATVHSGVHRWSQLRPEEREIIADTGGPAQGPVGRTQQAELRKIR